MSPPVESRLRVRFSETDAQGIVYYANYLVWFEVGRMDWMRAHGITWQSLIALDRELVVAHVEADYFDSARYDDEIVVRTFVSRVGNKSMTVNYEVYRLPEEVRLVAGHTVLVCVDSHGATHPLPPDIRRAAMSGL